MVKFFDWMAVILFEFYHWFFSVEIFFPKVKNEVPNWRNGKHKKITPQIGGWVARSGGQPPKLYPRSGGVIPNQGRVARSGKSAVLKIDHCWPTMIFHCGLMHGTNINNSNLRIYQLDNHLGYCNKVFYNIKKQIKILWSNIILRRQPKLFIRQFFMCFTLCKKVEHKTTVKQTEFWLEKSYFGDGKSRSIVCFFFQIKICFLSWYKFSKQEFFPI